MSREERQNLEARDAITAVILGVFFAIVSLPVLGGVFYAVESIDRAINVVAGLILLFVGVGFIARGQFIHRKSRTHWTD